jgi:hypothetical protein
MGKRAGFRSSAEKGWRGGLADSLLTDGQVWAWLPIMTRLHSLIGCLIIAPFFGGMSAEAKDEEDAMKGVIGAQIEAFRKNDFKTAYGFAHSGVKAQFTQADFEKMVRGGFAPMMKPGAAEFALAVVEGREAAVDLTLTAEDGTKTSYRYFLEKEDEAWRITAVVPVEIVAAETLV